jgi:hypothetical protein
VLITGKTGSGKTYLASYMTKPLKRLVVLDGKGSLSGWNLEPWDNQSISKLNKRDEPVRIRALPPFGVDPDIYWNKVLSTCYLAGNCTIYIDELYAISPPNQRPSPELFGVYTRGREPGVGVWGATQRPVSIPLIALSEAEHFFMFRLSLGEDRQRMSAFMTYDVVKTIQDTHGFYYMFAEWDKPIYVKQLEAGGQETPKVSNIKSTFQSQRDKGPRRTRRLLHKEPLTGG